MLTIAVAVCLVCAFLSGFFFWRTERAVHDAIFQADPYGWEIGPPEWQGYCRHDNARDRARAGLALPPDDFSVLDDGLRLLDCFTKSGKPL